MVFAWFLNPLVGSICVDASQNIFDSDLYYFLLLIRNTLSTSVVFIYLFIFVCVLFLINKFFYELFYVFEYIIFQDDKDKKIQELMAELRVKKRLSAAYREQLNTFIKDVEEHNERLSVKVQVAVDNLKELETKRKELLQIKKAEHVE